MDGADLLQRLWLLTWTGSLAMLAVLALRGFARHRFGANVAYALWLLVPAAMLSTWLPAPTRIVRAAPEEFAARFSTGAIPSSQLDIVPWLLLGAWVAGVVALACRLYRAQRRFENSLGRLECVDTTTRIWRAERTTGLPALVGVWQPAIVVPADMEHRYDACERELMVLHELAHRQAGDAWANAAVAAWRIAFWFNPLVHWCAGRLRHDQELACDARVAAARPQSVRRYAETMLKSQYVIQPAPLGCHWGDTHPLKERIMQLKQHAPSTAMQRCGMALVAATMALTAFAAWSAQPAHLVAQASGPVNATGLAAHEAARAAEGSAATAREAARIAARDAARYASAHRVGHGPLPPLPPIPDVPAPPAPPAQPAIPAFPPPPVRSAHPAIPAPRAPSLRATPDLPAPPAPPAG